MSKVNDLIKLNDMITFLNEKPVKFADDFLKSVYYDTVITRDNSKPKSLCYDMKNKYQDNISGY